CAGGNSTTATFRFDREQAPEGYFCLSPSHSMRFPVTAIIKSAVFFGIFFKINFQLNLWHPSKTNL
ncbi:MAG: hypothetical protein ACFN3G_07425, partial [Granulicatella adiacens]